MEEKILIEKTTPVQSKDELEQEKLRAEIRHLNTSFYRTPKFWLSVLPFLLALIGLVFQWQAWAKDREQWERQEESRNLTLREAEVASKQARIELVVAREELTHANEQLESLEGDAAYQRSVVSELEITKHSLESTIKMLKFDLLAACTILLQRMGRSDVDPLAATVDPTRKGILWIATDDAIYKSEDSDGDGQSDRLTTFADGPFGITERGMLHINNGDGLKVVKFWNPSIEIDWIDNNGDDRADDTRKWPTIR